MIFYLIYKILFTILSIGLFIFNLRKTFIQFKDYSKIFNKIPDGIKSYANKRIKIGIIRGINDNKFLIILNILLLLLLVSLNILIWLIKFD